MDIEALKGAFSLLGSAIGLAKKAKELLPDGAEKKSVEQSLVEAERQSKLAEAQIAQALGYELCRCTFPPQPMLSLGYREQIEYYQCPKCKKIWPPDTGPPEMVTDFDPFEN